MPFNDSRIEHFVVLIAGEPVFRSHARVFRASPDFTGGETNPDTTGDCLAVHEPAEAVGCILTGTWIQDGNLGYNLTPWMTTGRQTSQCPMRNPTTSGVSILRTSSSRSSPCPCCGPLKRTPRDCIG